MENAAGILAMSVSRPGKERKNRGKTMDFREVYSTHFHPLYAFIAYRVGNRQVAEDITSTVFEKALRSYNGYDPERAAISTWLYTIARNAVTDHYRSQDFRNHSRLDEEVSSSPGGDPVLELEAGERKLQLASALSTLEEREQEILALKFGAGMNNREIAVLIEVSESNVGTILYRSLKKLKTRLEDGIDNE